MRLMLLEDDAIFGEGLRDFLRADGHNVDWCSTIAQAKSHISKSYDALLLDWNLPDGSGMSWLKSLRAQEVRIPVIMLTARDLLHDRIQCLDTGADDFIVKPFAPEEVSARLRAIVRRVNDRAHYKSYGEIEVDLSIKTISRAGKQVELTAREWAILEALLLRVGRVVSKNDLESLVCGYQSELASNAIEVHIFKLRSKLGKTFIQTVRGLGYRLPNT